ncbi:MAG: NADH-quinone oxidoreductase subunit C [Gammaproteobacteria bacterium]|nr:NADH-quinone oxidoreductase subunit C [Gammaproteobacteria bacterium]MCW5583157.1 NADH-quinone oxidoreductase subunit C [Gammaproteobacteria bacterium]
MTDVNALSARIHSRFAVEVESLNVALGEITVEVKPEYLLALCQMLRDEADFDFKLLVDVCGVDYLHYGLDDWQTDSTTATGFGRGVTALPERKNPVKPNRFAVVYHLLSLEKNHRIRLRVNLPNEKELILDSVIDIWPAANWFERETFDLFGILFRGHPDLRRILTDYGFVGHPFRKDFPLIGKVEARYDATLKRVVYEPVSIEARVLEPKVIRHDNRYLSGQEDVSHGK